VADIKEMARRGRCPVCLKPLIYSSTNRNKRDWIMNDDGFGYHRKCMETGKAK